MVRLLLRGVVIVGWKLIPFPFDISKLVVSMDSFEGRVILLLEKKPDLAP